MICIRLSLIIKTNKDENNKIIDTSDGFGLRFTGERIVNLLGTSLWALVQDSENYIVFSLIDPVTQNGIDVIIVKQGKLTPLERLAELEKENEELKKYLKDHPGKYGIFLETAHPVKFLDTVEESPSPNIKNLKDNNY